MMQHFCTLLNSCCIPSLSASLCLAAGQLVCVVPSQYLGVSQEHTGIIQLGQMSTDHGSSSCCRWTRGMSLFLFPSFFKQFLSSVQTVRGCNYTPVSRETSLIFTSLSLLWNYLLKPLYKFAISKYKSVLFQNSFPKCCWYSINNAVCLLIVSLLWSVSTYKLHDHQKLQK